MVPQSPAAAVAPGSWWALWRPEGSRLQAQLVAMAPVQRNDPVQGQLSL